MKVFIAIRVRGVGATGDACLHDVSSRGVLVQAASAPPRGTVVELIGPFAPVAARVIWSNGRRFGAELQDRLDVQALTCGKTDRRSRAGAMLVEGGIDRRAKPPVKQPHAYVGRWMQAAATFLIGVGVAGSMAFIAYDSFANAAASIRAGLDADFSGSVRSHDREE